MHIPLSAFAQAPTLYQRMRSATRVEVLRDTDGESTAELAVKRYVAGVFHQQKLTAEDVDHALHGDFAALCPPETRKMSLVDCRELAQDIVRLTEREEHVRALGRDLQIIATGYELPVGTLGESNVNLPLKAQSIMRIWQAGNLTNDVVNATSVRVQSFPPETYAALRSLYTTLDALRLQTPAGEDWSEFRGAGWRYQYGVHFVNGEFAPVHPPPSIPPGMEKSEALYLFRRWPAVEQMLRSVEAALPEPTLAKGEVLVYDLPNDPRDPGGQLKDLFRQLNLSVWVYRELNSKGTFTTGDIGLRWVLPIEPVLPALCADPDGAAKNPETCTPILGGRYPPTPEHGNGLCLQPLARSGYLCRPMRAAEQPNVCQPKVTPTDQIQLARCTDTRIPTETVSGPDVCQEIDWRVTPRNLDPVTQCRATIACTNNVPPVLQKELDGSIRIVSAERPGLPAEYQLLRQMTVARHLCGLPPRSTPYPGASPAERSASCCRVEGDALRVACEAMEADRLFGSGSLRVRISNTIEANAVTCADILTDASCRAKGFGSCPGTFTQEQSNADVDRLRETLLNLIGARWQTINQHRIASTPDGRYGTCSYWENRLTSASGSLRIAAHLRALNQIGNETCTPQSTTSYDNTIGNNICYLGQCVEQSLEQHRITPGRQPFTVNDPAYPWDSCQLPQRNAGQIATEATEADLALPPYRPALLLRQIDTAFCQVSGSPPESPPTVCASAALRNMLPAGAEALSEPIAILSGTKNERTASSMLEQLSEAIGSRIGSELYAAALQSRVRALATLTTNAANLLETLSATSFTRTMCPINDANGQQLRSTEACVLPPQP